MLLLHVVAILAHSTPSQKAAAVWIIRVLARLQHDPVIGPKCGLRVSMITATHEDWIVLEASKHPIDPDRRSFLGWCRVCKDRYHVEEKRK